MLCTSAAMAQNYIRIVNNDSIIVDENISALDSLVICDAKIYAAEWYSLGMGTYREDLVSTFFGVQNLTYEVEIETLNGKPGMYRLVNPYGAAYAYNAVGEYDSSKNYYMYIDATDPDAVVLEKFDSGMDWGYGNFIFWSYAGYYLDKGYSIEEIANLGFFGKLENGIITFPTNRLLTSLANYLSGNFYAANKNGMFAVALPGYSLPDATSTAATSALYSNQPMQLRSTLRQTQAVQVPFKAEPTLSYPENGKNMIQTENDTKQQIMPNTENTIIE